MAIRKSPLVLFILGVATGMLIGLVCIWITSQVQPIP